MYIERPKGFKKLVIAIQNIGDEEQRGRVFWEIDRSFERDVISWQDHELLYELASRIQAW